MFAGVALFAIRTLAGSAVTDALADAPNAHAVSGDVWDIATSLLVDVAQGGFLFGLFLVLGAWLAGAGRRATSIRRARRTRCASARGSCARDSVPRSCCSSSGVRSRGRRGSGAIAIFTVLAYLWLELIRRRTLEEFPDESAPRLSMPFRGRTRGQAGELERLAALRERGVLSQAEFDREKAALLSGGRQPAEA